jgi:hypothetical protein
MTLTPAWRDQVRRYQHRRSRTWIFAFLLAAIAASVLGIIVLA